jgi:hypothetical protein
MKEKFEEIIRRVNELQADGEMTVTKFGKNKDLTLFIHKDCEFNCNAKENEDDWNLVTISTKHENQFVDDTDGIYVTDGSLYKELERIYHYRSFLTL